jgi:outer membrane protein TolC
MPFCLFFSASAQAAVLSLEDAVNLAASSNSGLASMKSRAKAMAEIPPQAGSLPDPVLSLNAMNLPVDSFSATSENMTQMQVGIAQSLPFPGKLFLREQAAGFVAESAAFDADEMRQRIIRNTSIGWWNLFYLDQALSIVVRNQVLLRQFVRIAESKYKTGQGLQSDVLLAQVELSKLLDVEIALKAARRGQAAQLNSLMNRPANTPVLLPHTAPQSLPLTPKLELLRKLAAQKRPWLAAQQSAIDAADRRVELAKRDYYPDFKLGATYGFRSGLNPVNRQSRPDFTSIMLSFNLPIFTGSKQDRALAMRKAEAETETFSLQDRRTQVDAEIEQGLADYHAAYDQALLFKTGIIPQASQTVASMLASYQVNKVDFLNLVRAQITLYNYETQYWKALSSGWQAWARLEAAVGVPLDRGAAKKTDKERSHE